MSRAVDARVVFDRSISTREMIAAMDRAGVESAWLCAPAIADIGECREVNAALREAVAESCGRLEWAASVAPLARGAMREVYECASRGAIAVGELYPRAHKWAIDEPIETRRFAAACAECGVFMIIRADSAADARRGLGRCGAAEIAAFARSHPSAAAAVTGIGAGLCQCEVDEHVAREMENIFYLVDGAPQEAIAHAMMYAPHKVIWSGGLGVPTAPPSASDTDALAENARRLLRRAAMFSHPMAREVIPHPTPR